MGASATGIDHRCPNSSIDVSIDATLRSTRWRRDTASRSLRFLRSVTSA